MATHLKEVDHYIEQSAEFARPILVHLRQLIHSCEPLVEEKIKWGMPFFEYKGTLAHLASFKAHCAFGFWKASLIEDLDEILQKKGRESMGDLGRITSQADLPSDDILKQYIIEAIRLNEAGVTKPTPKKNQVIVPPMPDYFKKALAENPTSKANFADMPPSYRKEYILHLEDAKTEATRQRRLDKTLIQLTEKNSLNSKYKKP